MLLSISGFLIEMMVRTQGDLELARSTGIQYRAVFHAIKARDPAAAREAMRAHFDPISASLGVDYSSRLDLLALRGLASLGYGDVEELVRDVVPEPRREPTPSRAPATGGPTSGRNAPSAAT
jgi:hypothetical protein